MLASMIPRPTSLRFGGKPLVRNTVSNGLRPRPTSRNLRQQQQTRSFGNRTDQFDPGLGGPYGSEVYPYSNTFHRECALETGAGVFLSGVGMYALSRFERFRDSIRPRPVGKASILVYDSTKGELDDVKMIRPEDLGKMNVVG